MNILIQGTTILAVNVTDSGDSWTTPDQIIPKHVVDGATVIEAGALPYDYAPGKYSWLSGFELIPMPPAQMVVPYEITAFQAKAALLNAGLLAGVTTYMTTAPAFDQLAWASSTTFQRDSITLNRAAAALGMTSNQVDQLFIEAARIVA